MPAEPDPVGTGPVPDGIAAAGTDRPPAELQWILDCSEPTPAGRSFYPTEDLPMREAARMLAPQPGYYVVDLHGTPDRAKVGEQWLDADQLAALIRSAPDWDGRPIFLMCCQAGSRPDGLAQQLSDALRVEVAAPDKLAWSDFEPTGPAEPYSSDAVLDPSGVPFPVKPPTGVFVTFNPDDGRSTGADGRGVDRAAEHRAAEHRAAEHRAAEHRAAEDRAGPATRSDHPAADHPAADRPAGDRPAGDRPAEVALAGRHRSAAARPSPAVVRAEPSVALRCPGRAAQPDRGRGGPGR